MEDGTSSVTVQDSDKHVDRKPHIEEGTGHEYNDFARKMMVNIYHGYVL